MRLGVLSITFFVATMFLAGVVRGQGVQSAEFAVSPGSWTVQDEIAINDGLMKRLSLDGGMAFQAKPLSLGVTLENRVLLDGGSHIDGNSRTAVTGQLQEIDLPIVGFAAPVQYDFNLAGADVSRLTGAQYFSNGVLRNRGDGRLSYTVAVDAVDASGLRVHFTNFDLPPGAELFVYSLTGSGGQVEGPYTGKGPNGNGDFWSNTLFDAVAFIELQADASAAAGAPERLSFTVESVAYLGGPYFFGGSRNSFTRNQEFNTDCITDANCNTADWPEIDIAKNAMALMMFPVSVGDQVFMALCSGGLLNDIKPASFIPYFLTANHCITFESEAAGLECFWRFETFKCSPLEDDDFGAGPQIAERTVKAPIASGGREPNQAVGPDIAVSPDTLVFNLPQTTNPEIFVEIDWMENSSHSHKPDDRVIERIIQTFAVEGYTIHLDVSNAIPHQDALNITTVPLETNPDISAIVNQHFDHRDDPRYHYSIWGHDYAIDGIVTGSSGIADLPGRVHLVTLGSFFESRSFQAGTFVHEFGHNIGQTHGGADHANFKPNYLSVMNYFYQLDGIGNSLLALGFSPTASGFNNYGFSHGLQASLDENNLNEAIGLGLGIDIDWDCDGMFNETGVMKDLQSDFWCFFDGSLEVLEDFDNWSTVNDFVRTNSGSGIKPASLGELQPCITAAEHKQLRSLMLSRTGLTPEAVRESYSLRSGHEPDDLGPPPVRNISATQTFTIQNVGDQLLTISSITLNQSASWIDFDASFPIALNPNASTQINVRVDFVLAPPGMSSRRLIIASNDPDENPYPNGVNILVNNAGMTREPIAPDLDTLPTSLGSSIQASSPASDFTLLRLNQDPPPGSTFLGWTTAIPAHGSQLVRLSHPAGLPLAYSRHTRIVPFYVCEEIPPTHYLHSVQVIGSTRGGSSGSPIMTRGMKVVGQLLGACGTNNDDICSNDFSDTIDGRFTRTFPFIKEFINSTGPDLKIKSFTLNKTQSRPGRPLVAVVEIKNRGQETARNFVVRISLNSPDWMHCGTPGDWEMAVPSLAPQEVQRFRIEFVTPSELGPKTARVSIDTDCAVEESDEANNQAIRRYSVIP